MSRRHRSIRRSRQLERDKLAREFLWHATLETIDYDALYLYGRIQFLETVVVTDRELGIDRQTMRVVSELPVILEPERIAISPIVVD